MSNDIKDLRAESLKSVREIDNHTMNLIDVSDGSKALDAASMTRKGIMSQFEEPVKAMQASLDLLRNCPNPEEYAWLFKEIEAKARAGEPIYKMLLNS